MDAVKSRLHRARASVRALLEERLGEDSIARRPDCPDVLTAFSKKLEGDLDADALRRSRATHRHLRRRAEATCDSLKRALAICGHLPARPVPEDIKEAVRKAVRDALAVTRKQLVQD